MIKLRLIRVKIVCCLYVNSTRKITLTLSRKLQTFISAYLHRVIGVFWPDTISSKNIAGLQARYSQTCWSERWQWIGHPYSVSLCEFFHLPPTRNIAITTPYLCDAHFLWKVLLPNLTLTPTNKRNWRWSKTEFEEFSTQVLQLCQRNQLYPLL